MVNLSKHFTFNEKNKVTMNSFQNPLILLFIVSAIGYIVGRIKIFGSSIGISAILFVGLFIGAFDSNNNIPVIIFELGLVLFVYSLGVNSGKVFFQSIKNNGLRDITFVVSTLTVSVLIALLVYYLFDLSPELITGIYTGTTTNTPALAGVIQTIRENNVSGLNEITQSLTIGYTFSYPMGIIGVIIALKLMSKLLKIDYKKEFNELKKIYPLEESLSSKSVKITNHEIAGKNLREITNLNNFNILYGRICKPNSKPLLTNWETIVDSNDDLMIIGNIEELERVIKILGEESESNISYDRKLYDVKTIFISNPKIIGREISSLNLNQKYDATITRIRRGDIDLLAKPNLTLELGDRIRFCCQKK